MSADSAKLKLPMMKGEKFLETASSSVYVQWPVSRADMRCLTQTQRKKLVWEFKCSLDGKAEVAEARFNASMDVYKARIAGLRPDTKYRISVRSKLATHQETVTGVWRHLSVRTAQPSFAVIVDTDELEIESLRAQLQAALAQNKKLNVELKKQSHEQWQPAQIVAWISSLGGAFEKYKDQLLDTLTEEGITGAELYMVTESDLKAWGVQFKDRKLLMRCLSQLTANDVKSEPLSQESPDMEVLSDQDDDEDEEQQDQVEEDNKNEEAVPEKDKAVAVNTNDEPEESAAAAISAQETTDATEAMQAMQPAPKETADLDDQKSAPALEDRLGAADKILQDVDDEAEKNKKNPKGTLTVTVLRAVNVPKVDKSDESDPYVCLQFPGEKDVRTPAVQDQSNPRWKSDNKWHFRVNNAFNDVLVLNLYDWNKVWSDKLIGKVTVPVIAVMSDRTVTKQFNVSIVSDPDVPKTNCKLEVAFRWMAKRT